QFRSLMPQPILQENTDLTLFSMCERLSNGGRRHKTHGRLPGQAQKMSSSPKTVAEVLKAGADYLAKHGVDAPQVACELLLGRLLHCRRLDVHTRHDQVLDEKRLEAMRRGINRVAAGEPAQYVTGETEFMGRAYKTDKRALIPRPETELLVEEALGCAPLWQKPQPAVLDWGTGAGCVAISLALARPGGLYLALDTSADALALARENSARHGLENKIGFSDSEVSDLLEAESMDAIAANPPYVPTAEWEKLPRHIRDHEPRAALDGGPTGLAVIESVIQDAALTLRLGGFLFLEIGHQQGAAVTWLLASNGFSDAQVKKDMAGHDRIVTATLAGPG
ncbi:MAG: peptide chain release factor N(5)-glutamine methyltransferase, partial [Verrucomicrobiota bacterium]|nr:peptide chain release factor N(5)-glutamine methyltransferase [Verrucomicrobiota bacterium]